MSLDEEVNRVKFSKSFIKKQSWTFRQSVNHSRATEGFYRGHPSGPTRTPTGRLRKRPRVPPTRGEGWPTPATKGKVKKMVVKKTKNVKQPQSIKVRSKLNWGRAQRQERENAKRVRHQRSRRGG